ncbi:MAG: RbsD/FucU domain-containing protein [Terracidiphilus sp.]|jgi:L-fucose mutarotase/ribose pyranase (RbsD/FucU family)
MSDLTPSGTADWEHQLSVRLPQFGHRNWIVVADAAYPSQSSPGIKTIAAGVDQINVLRTVLDAFRATKHIRANVYLDYEMHFVPEKDAPGVERYKQELDALLAHSTVFRLPHEQIIQKLDQSARVFKILIIKTQMLIPYTSVFFELDCGYWNREAEERLREAIMKAHGKTR